MNTIPNPSLFVRLPQVAGIKWIEQDVMEAIDNLDYGVIEEVAVYANSQGSQYAIVHFERWLRCAEDVANDIMRGAKFNVPGLHGKLFNVSKYNATHTRSYVRDPRNNRVFRTNTHHQKRDHVVGNAPRDRLPLINAVHIQTIADRLPIAPTLTGHARYDYEFEDGEIICNPNGLPVSRR